MGVALIEPRVWSGLPIREPPGLRPLSTCACSRGGSCCVRASSAQVLQGPHGDEARSRTQHTHSHLTRTRTPRPARRVLGHALDFRANHQRAPPALALNMKCTATPSRSGAPHRAAKLKTRRRGSVREARRGDRRRIESGASRGAIGLEINDRERGGAVGGGGASRRPGVSRACAEQCRPRFAKIPTKPRKSAG